MKKQEYAKVDIENTGGNAGGSRSTEIAIIIHNGTSKWRDGKVKLEGMLARIVAK